ncbi:MBL fold metallo-hydrolase [Salipiger mangrovisoli]|uniref:MBL fold metallo-hydrolase n=1 Tax=Salipiger mangrovisoli TaxID=2865933 RepID=A0ABR9X7V2_9RHOB|nr:MBL fold metallo-hydrolase [Salipiger mangrovisoli]MBE9639651.1 MBL fold metallo-hydrolase [Salipiger mangrovisoli]
MDQTPQKRKDPVESLRQGCERPWEVEVAPFRVAPRTYYVGNAWVGAYLLETSEGLILIDSTMQPQSYLLFEAIRRAGFDPKDIKILLLSHMHYDHVGAARVVAEYSGCKVMMSREDYDFLNDRPDMLFDFGYAYGGLRVDGFFDDATPVRLGDREVTTLLTPGHTPGTTSFFFDAVAADGARYRCGLHGGVGLNTMSTEFLKTHNLPMSLQQDYLASLRRLREIEVDIALGSHPIHVRMFDRVPMITEAFNPFVAPEVWPEFIDSMIENAERLFRQ